MTDHASLSAVSLVTSAEATVASVMGSPSISTGRSSSAIVMSSSLRVLRFRPSADSLTVRSSPESHVLPMPSLTSSMAKSKSSTITCASLPA